QRVATVRSFREYILGITFHIKANALLGLLTATADDLATTITPPDLHVSTISDTIVVLQYAELEGEIRRAVNVLKMRGSNHDKAIREFVIHDGGMDIGESLGARPWRRYPPR